MSVQETEPEHAFEEKRAEALDELYEYVEELQTIADSDTKYAKYAQAGLENLEEAGYDV